MSETNDSTKNTAASAVLGDLAAARKVTEARLMVRALRAALTSLQHEVNKSITSSLTLLDEVEDWAQTGSVSATLLHARELHRVWLDSGCDAYHGRECEACAAGDEVGALGAYGIFGVQDKVDQLVKLATGDTYYEPDWTVDSFIDELLDKGVSWSGGDRTANTAIHAAVEEAIKQGMPSRADRVQRKRGAGQAGRSARSARKVVS